MGVSVGLNVLTGTAFATPSITNPSDAKYDCGVIDNLNQVTGHGANNNDGYQSTCDPTDFGGNGQEFGPGLQTGKPCAGCVGRADDKNPPGQFPDGSDHNSGYECDGRDRPSTNQNGNGNHGIGDENPAHTGCGSNAGTSGSTCPDGTPMTNPADCEQHGGKTCPDGTPMTNAVDCDHHGGAEVLGNSEEIVTPPPVLQAVLAAQLLAPTATAAAHATPLAPAAIATPAPGGATLAFTGPGSLTYLLAAVGSLLLLLGMLLVRATKEQALA
jgi:hypothetical protein